MKAATIIMLLILMPGVFAITFNGKEYFKVTSTDPNMDSGNEVCTSNGMACVGYTEKTNAVCKLFNPSAADSSSFSGDSSGVYCDGAPQTGVCSGLSTSCHTCPACTVSVKCGQSIAGLYREMYVECSSGSCKLAIPNNVNDFFNGISGLNAQLKACPQTLPKGFGMIASNGNTIVDVNMNNGQTKTLTITIAKGVITGISNGGTVCKQRVTISENDLASILGSSSGAKTAAYLISQGNIKVKGCNFFTGLKLFFANPIVKFIAKKQAPTAPAPKPAPNCGNVGEQCNNRACFSGMCGAPEENVNGQWRHVNYRCIDQSTYTANCLGQGNTPPAWHCITGPCY